MWSRICAALSICQSPNDAHRIYMMRVRRPTQRSGQDKWQWSSLMIVLNTTWLVNKLVNFSAEFEATCRRVRMYVYAHVMHHFNRIMTNKKCSHTCIERSFRRRPPPVEDAWAKTPPISGVPHTFNTSATRHTNRGESHVVQRRQPSPEWNVYRSKIPQISLSL